MKIACVALVGKANNPLYLKTFDVGTEKENVLKFYFIVHTALDIIEEKVHATANAKSKTPQSDMYLGLLCPTEDYRVYGYITNTHNKFLLVVDDSDAKDHDIRSFFRSLHVAFADAVSNPFYSIDEKITSKSFDQQVAKLVKKKM